MHDGGGHTFGMDGKMNNWLGSLILSTCTEGWEFALGLDAYLHDFASTGFRFGF